MYLCDLSAIDKLIDFHNENTLILYNGKKFSLYELKDYLIDNNLSFSIDMYIIKNDGIYLENKKIISVISLRSEYKDDLIDL